MSADRIVDGVAYAKVTTLSPYSDLPLNSRERRYCFLHAPTCISTNTLAKKAKAERIARFGADIDDDRGNAFKHCYWNALMAAKFGAGTAKTIGDNHEDYGPDYNVYDNSIGDMKHRMDLWNNAVGRSQSGNALNGCLSALQDGRLRYLPNGPGGAMVSTATTGPTTTINLRYYEPLPLLPTSGGRAVSLSKGASAQGRPGCTSSACAYMSVYGQGFTPNSSQVVECISSAEGVFYTYYARVAANGTLSSSACYFGYPGQSVSVRVGGVPSNVVRW